MRIGMPQALLYHYYHPLWTEFFRQLGHEVVVSAPTNRSTLNDGVKVSVPEICVPIKIFNGHVLSLLEQNVDYVFVPRMVSIKKGQFFCPKFMGLPDLVRFGLPGAAERLLTCSIEATTEAIDDPTFYFPLCGPLGCSQQRLRDALSNASQKWRHFRSACLQGYDARAAANMVLSSHDREPPFRGDINIGLLGYVYNVYDDFLSMDVRGRLRELGVGVITFESLSEQDVHRHLKHLPKTLFWTFSDKLWAAGYYFYKNREIDGLVHLTAFGCGPDSMLGKVLELDSSKYDKPFMTLRIDEHTGESHLLTRVEAFVDMIRLKKQQAIAAAQAHRLS